MIVSEEEADLLFNHLQKEGVHIFYVKTVGRVRHDGQAGPMTDSFARFHRCDRNTLKEQGLPHWELLSEKEYIH